EDRERLVAETVAAYGPVDILINNAAVTFFAPVAEFSEKRMKLMMEIQVYAPFHLAQLVLPAMKEKKQGWIVNISSGAGRHPQQPYKRTPCLPPSGMCKAALERFSTGLASEVKHHGIAVNAVSPGLVATPGLGLQGVVTEKDKERYQPI